MDFVSRVYQLCVANLRTPDPVVISTVPLGPTGSPIFAFTPPLTVAEQSTYDLLVLLARSETGLSPTDYAAVRTQMQVLRDLRQMTRATFIAQTQAQMNRQLYDATVAICEIFLKLTRDS